MHYKIARLRRRTAPQEYSRYTAHLRSMYDVFPAYLLKKAVFGNIYENIIAEYKK